MAKKEAELAVTTQEFTMSIDDVKNHWARGATDKELHVFMETAKLYGLNPIKREIYFVKYKNNPGQTLIGYEYYLRRAEETKQLDGWNVVFMKDDFGDKAVVTVHRKDREHPFTWEVYRSEVDKKQALWNVMPMFMTKKVAIAQAFRLAFPEQLVGAPFIQEEVLDGEVIDVESEKPKAEVKKKAEPKKKVEKKPEPEKEAKKPEPEKPIVDSIQNLLIKVVELKKELGIADRDVWAELLKPHGVPSAKEMSSEQLTKFITELEALRPTPAPED